MGAGGVVRDVGVRAAVVDGVVARIADAGFEAKGLIESPLKGATGGNTEYLAHFVKREGEGEEKGEGEKVME